MPVAHPDPPLWPREWRVLPLVLALPLLGAPSSQPSAMAWGTPAAIVEASQLQPGPNSVTERRVRDRLAALRFQSVRFLRKDGHGIWRGLAWHRGQEVAVAMDARGRVAVETGSVRRSRVLFASGAHGRSGAAGQGGGGTLARPGI